MSYPINNSNKEGVRVVSDMSRFEYDSETPQFRSRNPTPPSGLAYSQPKPPINDYTDTLNLTAPKLSHTPQPMEEVLLDDGPSPPAKDSSYKRLSSMYSQNMNKSASNQTRLDSHSAIRTHTHTPLPPPQTQNQQQHPYETTPENHLHLRPTSNYYAPSRRYSVGSSFPQNQANYSHYPPPLHLYLPAYEQAQYQSQAHDPMPDVNDLPPMTQPADLVEVPGEGRVRRFLPESEFSKNPKKNFLRHMLLQEVMNKPVYLFPEKDFDTNVFINTTHISYHFFLYFFEVIFELIVIILSAFLISEDRDVNGGIYRYFVGSSVVEIIIALAFLTTIIDFENRNGNFYCFIATVLCSISFIMTCSQLLTKTTCSRGNICGMRKAVLAFVIMSTFLWIITMTMYLTTLYVARLDALEEVTFHTRPTQNQGYNELPPQKTPSEYAPSIARSPQNIAPDSHAKANALDPPHQAKPEPAHNSGSQFIDPETGKPLKQFYLSDQGEMYEIPNAEGFEHHNKILVYTF